MLWNFRPSNSLNINLEVYTRFAWPDAEEYEIDAFVIDCIINQVFFVSGPIGIEVVGMGTEYNCHECGQSRHTFSSTKISTFNHRGSDCFKCKKVNLKEHVLHKVRNRWKMGSLGANNWPIPPPAKVLDATHRGSSSLFNLPKLF